MNNTDKLKIYNNIIKVFPIKYYNNIHSIDSFKSLSYSRQLDVFVYEIALGVTDENVDDSIKTLDLIFSYYPYKKHMLKNIFKIKLNHISNATEKICKYYGYQEGIFQRLDDNSIIKQSREYNIDKDEYLDIFRKDDLEKYIFIHDSYVNSLNNNLKNSELIISIDEKYAIRDDLKTAIIYNSYEILKYLLKNINEIDEFLHYILMPKAINNGSINIITLLMSFGINMNKSHLQRVIDCHHYDIIDYYLSIYKDIDYSYISWTSSLYFRFVKDITFSGNLGLLDISCLDRPDIKHILKFNSINVATEFEYSYSIGCLKILFEYKHSELFKIAYYKTITSYKRLTKNLYKDVHSEIIDAVKNNEEYLNYVLEIDKTL